MSQASSTTDQSNDRCPRYPDWICIGAQKAATTWLYQQFMGVPGLFLPAIKELHYYSQACDERVARYSIRQRERKTTSTREYWEKQRFPLGRQSKKRDRRLAELDHLQSGEFNDTWYGGIFAFADPGDICGEICPSYLTMSQEGIDHALRLNPEAKIVIIVRDPIGRAWSHMRMVHDADRLAEINESPDVDKKVRIFVEYTDYRESIPRWRRSAGDDRVHLELFDNVISEPRDVLDRVSRFIGLTTNNKWPRASKPTHAGKPSEMPPRIRAALQEQLEPQYDFLAQEFPARVESWRQKHDLATGPRVV